MAPNIHLHTIIDPHSVITAIDSGLRFPEVLAVMREKYEGEVRLFAKLVAASDSSADLLDRIRSSRIPADRRMSLLKMFRRCVSGVCDTEMTKKIVKVSTASIVERYGHTFKPISKLKEQFKSLSAERLASLVVLVGEYDNRGHQGYVLTGLFFDWFEDRFAGKLLIEGPRGAGRDIELSSVIDGFAQSCPCDFVVRSADSEEITAVGFARYDSTRGGAQSDDRTEGNAGKVYKIRSYCLRSRRIIRIAFLADGPGLAHNDTWEEACALDGAWDGNVRVSTLRLADRKLTFDWLRGGQD